MVDDDGVGVFVDRFDLGGVVGGGGGFFYDWCVWC